MAKKQTINETERVSRQSRKEILRARKQEQQQRTLRIAAFIVGGILLLILLVAIVNEVFIAPNRPVATVNGQQIALSGWQERVKFERAQRIISLEEQLDNFNGDVGLVQQFSSQSIIELISENSEGFGEAILDRMVDEEIVRQGAEERGLLPTDLEVDERIGSLFNYYGGESPTPLPAPTETIVPTPSVTPIVFGQETTGVEESLPAPEEVPTSAPLPTATPVSEESFLMEFNDLMAQYKSLGVGEKSYRTVISQAIMSEQLMDALAEEQNLPVDDLQASFFYIVFDNEEEANATKDALANSDFITVWNTIRSGPADPEAEDASSATAAEVLWRTQDGLESSFGPEIAAAAFDLPLDTPSDVIVISETDSGPAYVIIMVSGREMRELSQTELQTRKEQLLQDFIAAGQLGDVEISELWRSRVPTTPILDPKFRQPPTPTPEVIPVDPGTGDAGSDNSQ